MLGRVELADDRGETLLELVIAILIMGVFVVAVGSGVAMSAKVSGLHQDQAMASASLHNYAEVKQNSYMACATPNTYANVVTNYQTRLAAPAGFVDPPSVSVKFWQPTPGTFIDTSGTCPASDLGLQQVTFTLKSKSGFVTESLSVVVRSP
jgi:type II secretory pathway pseudopilin PulG